MEAKARSRTFSHRLMEVGSHEFYPISKTIISIDEYGQEQRKTVSVLPRGRVVTREIGQTRGTNRTFGMVELGEAHEGYTAFGATEEEMLKALLFRQFLFKGTSPVMLPSRNVKAALSTAFKRLKALMGRLLVPEGYEQVVRRYVGDPRWARYNQARMSLSRDGVRRGDARVAAFLKYEKVTKDAVSRIISPRKPRYNLALGAYLLRAEGRLYRMLKGLWGERVVAKGLNAVDTAKLMRKKWERFNDPVAVSLDMSRFDQHVSCPMLEFEHSVWVAMFDRGCRAELERLLSWQRFNHVRARAGTREWQYSLLGTRMSGDINTSSGNCMIMCVMLWQYCHDHGLEASLINNGDDAVLFLERSELGKLAKLQEFTAELGFVLKVDKPVLHFGEVQFCQTFPFHTGNRYVMVRNVLPAIAKDRLCLHKYSGSGYYKWLYAVGTAGLALYADVPVLGSWYAACARSGRRGNVTLDGALRYLSKNVQQTGSITVAGRLEFSQVTGISVFEQTALEGRFGYLSISVAPTSRGT